MNPNKKLELHGSLEYLQCIRRKHSYTAETLDRYNMLLDTYKNPRAIIDEIGENSKGMSATERKEYLRPYTEMVKEQLKDYKPFGNKFYTGTGGAMKQVSKTLNVFFALARTAHLFRPDELKPPATDEEIISYQAQMRVKMSSESYRLEPALVDFYRICDGANVRLGPSADQSYRFFSLNEIPAQYDVALSYSERAKSCWPICEGGAGNMFAAYPNGEIVDLNHEDESIIFSYPALGKLLLKLKPRR